MFFADNLATRRLQAEIMDDPSLEAERHRAALRGLERINWWSGSARVLWPPLRALAREVGRRPLRVLDVASGAGDVPIRLWHKARRAGIDLRLEGCDRSPEAVRFADERARLRQAEVRFFVLDALADVF